MLTVLAPGVAFSQSGATRIMCTECRNPLAYPDDWVNFAFNQVYGENAWLDFDQADDFFVVNLEGDRVYVDVDFVMAGINVFGYELPLWPANLLKITVALPNGFPYEAYRSVFLTPLPVPSPSGPQRNRRSNHPAGGEGSGSDGVDDPENGYDDDFEFPEIEHFGITGIEDPGEDGEFAEPEWCEEC
jgi:hypothetical protein